MSPEKTTQDLTLQSTRVNGSITASDQLIARSITAQEKPLAPRVKFDEISGCLKFTVTIYNYSFLILT